MKLSRSKAPARRVTDRTQLRLLFQLFHVSTAGHDLQVRAHFEWLLGDAEKNYRARMKTLHPDISGEQEAAVILNKAMQRLREIAAKRGVIQRRPAELAETAPPRPVRPRRTAEEVRADNLRRQHKYLNGLSVEERRAKWRAANTRRLNRQKKTA